MVEHDRETATPNGPSPGNSSADAWERRLLWAFDCGLASLFFLAPLVMGGRHPVGRLAYVTLIGITACCWFARQCLKTSTSWRRSGAEWLMAASLALVALQLVPLGSGLCSLLSPRIPELLPAWQAGGGGAVELGSWDQVSLTPLATRGGLVMLLAYVLLFAVVVQRIGGREDIERILKWMAVAACGMALLALAQLLVGNGKYLGVYESPWRTTLRVAKGSFANQNHFAHFLALGVGPLIWWIQRLWSEIPPELRRFGARRLGDPSARYRLIAAQAGLGVVALAGMLTFSRGGIAAMMVAGAVAVVLLARRGLLSRRALLSLGGVALVAVVALGIHGSRPLVRKLDGMAAARSLEDLSLARSELWAAVGRASRDFWRLGAGVGSHAEVYPIYLETHYDDEFTHAENGYLQVLLETGVGGLLLLTAGILIVVRWCLVTQRPSVSSSSASCGAALAAGVAASMAHSLCDFVWYIPACVTLTVVLVACACRLAQIEGLVTARSWRPAPVVKVAAAVSVVILTFAMVKERIGPARAVRHWESYLRLSFATSDALLTQDDGDDYFAERTGQASIDATRRMIKLLDRALAADPADPRMNMRRASLTLRLFDHSQLNAENAMTLSQIREAAIASEFPSPAALNAWLERAIGDNRILLWQALNHCARGLRNGPLQGKGYVYLAELSFLVDVRAADREALMSQALTTRPHDEIVLIAAASDAMLANDEPQAISYFKRAFQRGDEAKRGIVGFMGTTMTAQDFVRMFEPDQEGLRELFLMLRRAGRVEEMKWTGQRLVADVQQQALSARHDEQAAKLWIRCCQIHRRIGSHRQAVDAARRALAVAPDDYQARRSLGTCLLKTGEFDEAAEHLRWCIELRPGDQVTREALALAHEGQRAGTRVSQDESALDKL